MLNQVQPISSSLGTYVYVGRNLRLKHHVSESVEGYTCRYLHTRTEVLGRP